MRVLILAAAMSVGCASFVRGIDEREAAAEREQRQAAAEHDRRVAWQRYHAEQEAAKKRAQDAESERLCAAAEPGGQTWAACLSWRTAREQAQYARERSEREDMYRERQLSLQREELDRAERERKAEAIRDIGRAFQAPYVHQPAPEPSRRPTSCTSRATGDTVHTNCW